MKKKRVSKRNKISWRKHVNIADVEEFLEDQRLEERLGPSLSTVSDEKLFKLDLKPSEEGISSKERARLRLLNPKCFSILRPHTQVPDPLIQRNHVKTKEERKNLLVKLKEHKNRQNGIFKAKERQSIRDKKAYELSKTQRPKRGDFNIDAWNLETIDLLQSDLWINDNSKKHNLGGIGKITKNMSKKPKLKKIFPAIETPHPGMSYNPSFVDHQNLLNSVVEKEAAIIKEEEHLNRVTRAMFGKVTPEKRDNAWLEEMSEGLPDKDNKTDEDQEGKSSDNEYKPINPPTVNAKKTLKQRRKQKEQRKLELLKRLTKEGKKKIGDIHQIQSVKTQIEKQDKITEKLREKRKKVKEIKSKQPKRLGPLKFEDQDLDFNMARDLSGNLRNVKKEGCIMTDRFKSMQKRNVIETSALRIAKRAKIKRYIKPGHKEDWKKTVAKTAI